MGRTLKTAVSEEDFDSWDRTGKNPKARQPLRPVEPKMPKIDNVIKLDKLELKDIESVTQGRSRPKRNEDGVLFMGYEVEYKEKGKKAVKGWMPEVDDVPFRRILYREGLLNVDGLEY